MRRVGGNHLDASFPQALIQRIAIVRFVANHALGQRTDVTSVELGLDQSGFIRRNARNPDGDYTFQLYALDIKLALGPDATLSEVEAAMQGHILGKGVLVGRFHLP